MKEQLPADQRPHVKKSSGRWGWECGCLIVAARTWRAQPAALADARRHAARHVGVGFRGGR